MTEKEHQGIMKFYRLLALLILFVFGFLTSTAVAQDENQLRHALVIGNADYKIGRLYNTKNDANDVAAVLQKLRFNVDLQINVNRSEMREAIRDFGDKLKKGGTGLFYYAGHGMQVKGVNYLIPVGSSIEAEYEVQDESINAGTVLRMMESAGNPLNIVILDACRDNPFARSFRSTQKGLAQMDAPKGSLIVYATAPGSTAADGSERNGIFTGNLLKYIDQPDLEIGQMLRKVRASVIKETEDKQIPWDSSSLTGEFYFAGNAESASPSDNQSYDQLPQDKRASLDRMAYPLPDIPSIAVLPFNNMSGDPDQEYFSDGLTEEIITTLAKVPNMFVIARNSTFMYKGKPVKVQQVAEDLGVRYILEGSVRKSKDRVRITAQLIDALTGHHLWAERYDRDLKEIFAVQDEITMKILNALEIKLTIGDQAHFWKKRVKNLDVYLQLLRAYHYFYDTNPESNFKARKIFETVISQDPNNALAYKSLAVVLWTDVWLGKAKSPKESLRKAVELTKKALSIDPNLAEAYGLLGHISLLKRDWEKGLSLLRKSVELDPTRANGLVGLGIGLNTVGRPEEAIPLFKKALRLHPMAPPFYTNSIASAYSALGKYDKAIEFLEKGNQRYPNNLFSHLSLSANYIFVGRDQEAHKEAKEVLRLNPNFSIDRFAQTLPSKNLERKKKFIEALRKAFSVQSDS